MVRIQSKPCQEVKAFQELQKQGYEVYLPTIEMEKIVGGKRIQKEEALFSCYLFVQLDQMYSNRGAFRSTCEVTGLVHFGTRITSLSIVEMNAIRSYVNELPKKRLLYIGTISSSLPDHSGICKEFLRC